MMSEEIAHPSYEPNGLTFSKIADLPVLQNFILLMALSNMAVNVARITMILSGNVCGKKSDKCKPNAWGYGGGYNSDPDRFRGPEMLCYSVMVYVHARLYTAVIEEDEETINVWLAVNLGLTAVGVLPGVTFPSLWGNDFFDSEALVGTLILDFVQYGSILEFKRALWKKKANQPHVPEASMNKTMNVQF